MISSELQHIPDICQSCPRTRQRSAFTWLWRAALGSDYEFQDNWLSHGKKADSRQTRHHLQHNAPDTPLCADLHSNTLWPQSTNFWPRKFWGFLWGRGFFGREDLLSDQFSVIFAHKWRKQFKQPQDPNEHFWWRCARKGQYLTGKPASLRDLAVPPEAIKPRPRAFRLLANSTRLVLSETLSKANRWEKHKYFAFESGTEKEDNRIKSWEPL